MMPPIPANPAPVNPLRMDMIPMNYALIVAWVLFVIGVIGVLARRNLLFILMSVEIMLNASGLAFVVAGSRWGQPDGQIMFIFILAMAAAEVSVGLALVLLAYHRFGGLDADAANRMKG
ncbi:MAG: NADH-quinone oxidoreductase subunit NuoK [Nitrospiraceae bacterium]|nr:NADH-quinone oxidoreductase subunit NuoK [Nitrospiraceae bacterium]